MIEFLHLYRICASGHLNGEDVSWCKVTLNCFSNFVRFDFEYIYLTGEIKLTTRVLVELQ